MMHECLIFDSRYFEARIFGKLINRSKVSYGSSDSLNRIFTQYGELECDCFRAKNVLSVCWWSKKCDL